MVFVDDVINYEEDNEEGEEDEERRTATPFGQRSVLSQKEPVEVKVVFGHRAFVS